MASRQTYTGTILVAVNPYKPVPLYGPEIVTKYSNAKFGALPPHIFAIADDAYRSIISDRPHKSILISGESGAGKTESTKLIINYLTYQSGEHTSVEQFLLESSPILESFGNATTSINNNSSRFVYAPHPPSFIPMTLIRSQTGQVCRNLFHKHWQDCWRQGHRVYDYVCVCVCVCIGEVLGGMQRKGMKALYIKHMYCVDTTFRDLSFRFFLFPLSLVFIFPTY